MLQLLEKLGLKRLLLLALGGSLAIVVCGAWLLLVRQGHAAAERSARERLQIAGEITALHIGPALALGKDDAVERDVEVLFARSRLAYAIVLRKDRSVAAKRVAPSLGARTEAILDAHARNPAGAPFTYEELTGVSIPVEAEPRPDGSPRGDRAAGSLLVGLDALEAERQAPAATTSLLGLAAVALALLLVPLLVAERLVERPVRDLGAVARQLSESDLTARAEKHGQGGLGSLGESLNLIGERLAATLSRVRGVSEGVGEAVGRIARSSTSVTEGTRTVALRIGETSASVGEMRTSLKGIAANVEVLAHSAEESSSSILEMAATNGEVAENVRSLANSVEETTAAIEQMTYSIKEVAKNIEDLSATSEETSSSMNEMDVSISHVESNANETAKLSEQAQKDAELGTEALGRTIAGIERIKESSKEAASVIDSLGKKIGTIGNILNVIDEVAEQTNLLALNAAILAAQSGEHGKGFAVVADEIKDLAERTGASTKEIAELIRSVQGESVKAVSTMERGVKNVEEGVRLGQEAETALRKIQASSQKSTQMVKSIARATLEQARGSKQVTIAINRIAETVQQIAASTAEQAKGSEQIMKSAEQMRVVTKQVERSSQEQADGSKQITRSIESISEMVNHLNSAQRNQSEGSERVMGAVEEIRRVAETQASSVRELETSIADLVRQADVLKDEVRRFKI